MRRRSWLKLVSMEDNPTNNDFSSFRGECSPSYILFINNIIIIYHKIKRALNYSLLRERMAELQLLCFERLTPVRNIFVRLPCRC